MATTSKRKKQTQIERGVRSLTRGLVVPQVTTADDILGAPTFPTLLDYLRLGCHLSSGCAATMLPYRKLMNMMRIGADEDCADASLRSLYLQIVAAIGDASVVSEAKVRDKDPLTFLRHGSRRILGDEWNSSEPIEAVNGRTSDNSPALPPSGDVLAALEELRRAGIITAVLPAAAPNVIDAAQ